MVKLFTSESVTEGHPDKICDQISDAILDAHLENDPYSRVACEVAVSSDYVLVFGEITSKAKIDIEKVVRNTIRDIGYIDDKIGFHYLKARVDIRINKQSLDISNSIVKPNFEIGAGDQGIMFGYANSETKEFMPLSIALANKLSKRLSDVRKNNIIEGLYPDGKTQVTIAYENNNISYIDKVVVSVHHKPMWSQKELKNMVIENVIKPILKDYDLSKTEYLINPSGLFLKGGPNADAGLTGRKIIVDTYGGFARHGGGAFSGKDPTKVDRSGAYMARYIAKNIVASGVADECEIELAYAIGLTEPVSLYVDCKNTEKVDLEIITDAIKETFNLTPKGIIEKFNMLRPIYLETASFGHFGHESYPWESLDKVDKLRRLIYN